MKIRNREKIKKILFITLSNIGDIILTTPALSVLRKEFPDANIDVMSGPSGRDIFSGHPHVSSFIVYDKFSNLHSKRQLVRNLRKTKYDLIVDFRNSLFPFLIGSRYRTSIIRSMPAAISHKKDRHLYRLKQLGLNIKEAPFSFYIDERDKGSVRQILAELGVKRAIVVVAPGAKSHIKRWTKQGFASLCDRLIDELSLDVIMVGDNQDKKIILEIASLMKNKIIDLSSRLNLRELGALIECSRVLVTNDSAPMHVGYAVGAKVLAIFGPTDPKKYGPEGLYDVVIRKDLACSPCEVAQCRKNHECMNLISTSEVFEAAKRILFKR